MTKVTVDCSDRLTGKIKFKSHLSFEEVIAWYTSWCQSFREQGTEYAVYDMGAGKRRFKIYGSVPYDVLVERV